MKGDEEKIVAWLKCQEHDDDLTTIETCSPDEEGAFPVCSFEYVNAAAEKDSQIASLTEEVKKGMKQALLNEELRKEIASLKELVNSAYYFVVNYDGYNEANAKDWLKRAKELTEGDANE